jgi:hypothetical protein
MYRSDGINIPLGKFYHGDAGYGCRPVILPLFRSTRYHLNKFTTSNKPKNPKELVFACCILHNWILGFGLGEHVPDEEDVQPNDIEVGHGVESTDNTT